MTEQEPASSDPGGDFAERLASAAPTPGGGAAAARAGIYAACLCRMVCAISLQRRREPSDADAELEAAARKAQALSADFRRLERADEEAFSGYLAALRLPRSAPQERARRDAARAQAARRATEVPLETLQAALRQVDIVEEVLALAPRVRLRAESDLGGALELACAAFLTAELNVLVNLPALAPADRQELEARHRQLRDELDRRCPPLRERIRRRLRGDEAT